jgi:hypothetical protein
MTVSVIFLLVVNLDCAALKFLEIRNPLGDGETLLSTPSSHLDSGILLGGHGVFNGSLELMEEMGSSGRFDSEPPTRLEGISKQKGAE